MVKLQRSDDDDDERQGFSTSQMLRGMNVDQTKRRVQTFCSAIIYLVEKVYKKKLDIMDQQENLFMITLHQR